MVIEEQKARTIVLVQAIDSMDTASKIVTSIQRAEAEASALQSTAKSGLPDQASRTLHFLGCYADSILALVQRQPAYAQLESLKTGGVWPRWAAVAIPLLALTLGILTDQVANPHRVDLLSLPLLAVVAWNLAMYLLLVVGLVSKRLRQLRQLRHRPTQAQSAAASMVGAGAVAPFADLRRWASTAATRLQRRGGLQARIAASFYAHWHLATAELAGQRIRRVLHLSAAAWALGLMLSLLSRGLVVEYRAGWESTFLDAGQVHAFLNLLFSPVVALFPVAPFTLEEIRNLRFDAGVMTPLTSGARWAWLYAGLFLLVVVLPRLALAAIAGWRIGQLRHVVRFELDSPYFQRLAASVVPARIHLGLLSQRDTDRNPLLRVLLQDTDRHDSFAAPSRLLGRTLMHTAHGDELLISDIDGVSSVSNASRVSANAATGAAGAVMRPGFFAALRQRLGASHSTAPDRAGSEPNNPINPINPIDMVLVVLSEERDLKASLALLQASGKPVLLIVHSRTLPAQKREKLHAAFESAAHEHLRNAAVIDMQSFAPLWVLEPALLDAIEKRLPAAQRPGFARIAAAWDARNQARCASSMSAIASHLVFAAQQIEDVPQPGFRLKLFGSEERRSQAALREAARTRVARKVDASSAGLYSSLCDLHGVPGEAATELLRSLDEIRVVPRPPLTSQQALVGGTGAAAGAAAGATVGAHVDVFTLGATLGAGAALGALVGGGAALAALVWKNRTTSNGVAQVQFSDEMLLAILESSLIRYLALAHYHAAEMGSISSDMRGHWTRLVIAEARLEAPALAEQWQLARTREPGDHAAPELQALVESMTSKILRTLYPTGHSTRAAAPASAPRAWSGLVHGAGPAPARLGAWAAEGVQSENRSQRE